MIVLALDPGVTTGYALAYKDDDTFDIYYGQAMCSHMALYHFIDSNQPRYIVCESFEFRQGKQLGVDLYPCELIGVVNLWAQQNNFAPNLYFQPASVQGKKAYFSDRKLKQMGLYIKGVEHGRSAVKHLLQWFYFESGYRFMTTDLDPILVQEKWFYARYR